MSEENWREMWGGRPVRCFGCGTEAWNPERGRYNLRGWRWVKFQSTRWHPTIHRFWLCVDCAGTGGERLQEWFEHFRVTRGWKNCVVRWVGLDGDESERREQ